MNKLFINIVRLIILSLIPIIYSCNENDRLMSENYGYLKLDFSADDELIVGVTKAEIPIFGVNIVNSQGVIVRSTLDHREFETNPIKLEKGIYYIQATNGEDVDCAFEKPFYTGADTVDIKSQNVDTRTVVCGISNVKVSVSLDPSVATHFKECMVAVKNEANGNGLIYSTLDNTIGRDGYFRNTGKLNWSMYLKNNNDIVFTESLNGEITGVSGKEHYVLNISVSEDDKGSASNIKVTINEKTNDVEHDLVIDITGKPAPSYSGDGFNISDKQNIAQQSPFMWKIKTTALNEASELIIKHNSLAMSNAGVPYTFDLFNLSAADATAINNAGITWSDIIADNKYITIDFTQLINKLPLGDYNIDLSTLDKKHQKKDASFIFAIIPSEEVTTLAPDAWAKRVFFKGIINTLETPAGMGFEYKLSSADDNSWIQVVTGAVINGKNYSIEVKGVEPNTEYVVRAISANDKSSVITFTTEQANQLPNMSFDAWVKSGKHWYANSTDNKSSAEFIWDSGNVGANTLSSVNPTAPTSTVAVAGEGKQAAHLQSKTVFGILAAGNIYTGQFGKTIGTSGAEIYFGRPYNCRPLSLKGHYSYAPVNINKTKDPYNHLSGQPDIFSIYVLLADWTGWFTVNTSAGKFINFDDPSIIAYSEIHGNVNTGGYVEFDLPLEYRSDKKPYYCVIVASASKYGDFFTGGEGSILLIDEFEFTF